MWSSNLKRALQIFLICFLCIYLCQFLIYDNANHAREQLVVISNTNIRSSEINVNKTMSEISETTVSIAPLQNGFTSNATWMKTLPLIASSEMINSDIDTTIRDAYKLDLDDIHISVKTTKRYHRTRLPVILNTWFQLAKDQTWFITDADDEELIRKTDGHMINSKCPSTHSRPDLCCKMSVEFDTYLESNKKWWCHFDDDNYVNIPRLVEVLSNFDPKRNWYLGKTSVKRALRITERISFWFATGGAGFCISKALALKMMSIVGSGKFMTIAEEIGYPDDVTMGYIIEHLMKTKLVVIEQFRSHLELMKQIPVDQFKKQISFGYFGLNSADVNVIQIDGFRTEFDPTRFYSLHCFLFPSAAICPNDLRKYLLHNSKKSNT